MGKGNTHFSHSKLGGMEGNELSSINFLLKLLKDSHTFSILTFNFKTGI